MMMSCLEAGGMSVVSSPERERFGESFGDERYSVNRGGMYEPDIEELFDPGWQEKYDGQAVKIVSPFVPRLLPLVCRVVFMHRDHHEIQQSHEAAFGERIPKRQIRLSAENALASIRYQTGVELIELHYSEVVADPQSAFERLRLSGWPVDPIAASQIVDPSLYRFRREIVGV